MRCLLTSLLLATCALPDSRVTWLELSARGGHVLFRDGRRRLHLLDAASGARCTLLPYCAFAAWVPGSDVVVAQSEQDNHHLWAIRDSVSEYGKVLGPIIGVDIGLPAPVMHQTAQDTEAAIRQQWPNAVVLFFGHIGDSNLHVVVHVPGLGAAQPHLAVDLLVYPLVEKAHGSVSAEHGVGLIKKPFLHCSRQPAEIALMKTIKQALDPEHLLNPGKIFDLPTRA